MPMDPYLDVGIIRYLPSQAHTSEPIGVMYFCLALECLAELVVRRMQVFFNEGQQIVRIGMQTTLRLPVPRNPKQESTFRPVRGPLQSVFDVRR